MQPKEEEKVEKYSANIEKYSQYRTIITNHQLHRTL